MKYMRLIFRKRDQPGWGFENLPNAKSKYSTQSLRVSRSHVLMFSASQVLRVSGSQGLRVSGSQGLRVSKS